MLQFAVMCLGAFLIGLTKAGFGGGAACVGVPRTALAMLQIAAHHPDDCPMCQLGVPLVKPGSRPT